MAGSGHLKMAETGDPAGLRIRWAGPMTHATTTTTTRIRLAAQENGPKNLSNGGFACGTFAGLVGGTAEVTLRAGVPLETELRARVSGDRAEVTSADHTLAEVERVEPFVLEPPVRPTVHQAELARQRHPFRGVEHPLTDCVVCGPGRRDGLQVTPGPLEDQVDVLASPFRPTERYAVRGEVRTAAVWGALDCPSYPAAAMRARRFCLLGSLRAHQTRPVHVGEDLVVVGWTVREGVRSVSTASAILTGDGAVVASAQAVWVALRDE